MQKAMLKIMPGDDEKLEHDLEKELAEMKAATERGVGKYETPITPPLDSPDLSVSNESLVKRSKASLANNIATLSERIKALDSGCDALVKWRDDEIVKLNREYQRRLSDLERDLAQVKTIRSAIELAHATMPDE